jgi:hypothetical protein
LRLCNPLLVPPGENDDTSLDADAPVLTANLSIPPGTVRIAYFIYSKNDFL